MNTSLVTASDATPHTGMVVAKGDNVEVTASTPDEMAVAQTALIAWAEKKLAAVQESAKELRAAYESALKRKWAHSTLKRHAEIEEKRLVFYEKLLTALRLGFMIVPNFPVTAFAIRTDKKKPLRMLTFSSYTKFAGDKQQEPGNLPAGEGDYQNPLPQVANYSSPIEGETNRKGAVAFDWDEMEFPITMAKAHIIEAVNRAMALKLFDDFGILPAAHIKQDPMIIARLKDPRQVGYGPKRYVSFMIAWHLDTGVL